MCAGWIHWAKANYQKLETLQCLAACNFLFSLLCVYTSSLFGSSTAACFPVGWGQSASFPQCFSRLSTLGFGLRNQCWNTWALSAGLWAPSAFFWAHSAFLWAHSACGIARLPWLPGLWRLSCKSLRQQRSCSRSGLSWQTNCAHPCSASWLAWRQQQLTWCNCTHTLHKACCQNPGWISWEQAWTNFVAHQTQHWKPQSSPNNVTHSATTSLLLSGPKLRKAVCGREQPP